MASFQIISSAGVDMGIFDGASAREAAESMWSDAGVEGSDALFAELIVREMHEYVIATDSATETIWARDIDRAAQLFEHSEADADDLARQVTEAGGWITISEDGVIVLRAGER
jgi:hypothetical protein